MGYEPWTKTTLPVTKHAIVLDLDSTLVHTFDSSPDINIYENLSMETKKRTYLLSYGGTQAVNWGIRRPYLKEFLSFCFSYFSLVTVWSAGQKQYVHEVVDQIFQYFPSPHIVFTRNDCTINNGIIEKPLSRMISRVTGLDWQNTFFLDDRPAVYRESPNNGIEMPIYEPVDFREGSQLNDIALLQLMSWFQQPSVALCSDVRQLNKTNIFSQDRRFLSPIQLSRPVIRIPTMATFQQSTQLATGESGCNEAYQKFVPMTGSTIPVIS